MQSITHLALNEDRHIRQSSRHRNSHIGMPSESNQVHPTIDLSIDLSGQVG